jgi:hypothetical protein
VLNPIAPTSQGPARVVRIGAVAAAGVVIAEMGHVAGGGSAGSSAVLVPMVLAAVGVAAVLSRVSWTVPRVAAGLTAIQVIVHGALWLGAGSASTHPRLSGLARDTLPTAHDHAMALTPSMVLAHLVAAVGTAVLLAAVDATWRLLAAFGRRLLRAATPPLAPPSLRSISPRGMGHLRVPELLHLTAIRGNAPPVPCLG